MINNKDLYSQIYEGEFKSQAGQVLGWSSIRYDVREFTDVRNLGQKNAYDRSYILTCTQRYIIPNSNKFDLNPAKAITSYANYPALLSSTIKVDTGANKNELKLIRYSPRTLNTGINSSLTTVTGATANTSFQHQSGSSFSQSNTFGGSASVGVSAEGDPSFSLGGEGSHTTTNETSTSDLTGKDTGVNSDISEGNTMSIKDWGAYSYLDTENTTPTWVWAQDYPWSIVQYRNNDTGNNVKLPQYVQDRLVQEGSISPPSHLSLFGIDFVMKSSWLISPPKTRSVSDTITLIHSYEYLVGSHAVATPTTVTATLDYIPAEKDFTSPVLNLSLLALDPILHGEAENGAVVGFIEEKFVVVPTAGAPYKILSGSNNLQIMGDGFDSPMTTNLKVKATATIDVNFKIVDDNNNFTLFLKHWVTPGSGVKLSIVINTSSPIEKTVTSLESEGGEKNLSAITLRNKDFASIDYHDYLKIGFNTISITISPEDPSNVSDYVIRALAIGT
jgi:hypothetical protein